MMRPRIRPPGGNRTSPMVGEPSGPLYPGGWTETGRNYRVPNYSRPTPGTTDPGARAMAAEVVRKRKAANQNTRTLGGKYVNGSWYDRGGRFIGTAPNEDAPIRFTKPRRLGNPRNR